MLPDPISVTYDGSSKSLSRTSAKVPGVRKIVGSSYYGTPNTEFSIRTENALYGDGTSRRSLYLLRTDLDGTPGPGTPGWGLPNGVGLTYIVNPYMVGTATDVPLLRTALLSLVDATLQSRILGGEV